MPPEAQFSSAQSAVVADFNNDGNEDIFLAQNFYAVGRPQQNPRIDGGRGLWLKGNGKGGFESVPGHISGVNIYGEQRAAAVSDFNKDGKMDLIVTQNGAETKLFLNQTQ